ncbi:breast carcinoma-amplified sequence 1 isoform X5 [Canis lupus familiaris]|uniref:breast carcinoma-amplified sequence 1 isoform X5 n=1 Tax=Canis lupus familiaris TaxID=9615 RepID=UPI0018F50699|nr:breast carcinoma-amplified sequence 1 isoform X5 [Canis lupus familiaris]XP_038313702.1 breast carcinoma-amplified sequence 1 isoform X5 [Canis lupus familiaris]XP_038428557.1 breast carcinoma-amplified sequence 1 isoform X5 [Canis lupus familiaris]
MGNEMSVPKRVEDQENESETDANKVASENKCGQNGTPVILSTHDITFYDEVDLGISVKEDNVATSSPKTMEISAVADANGKNLGKEAKPEAPAAKSRFFLTLSRPVPGRTGDQATDSSTGAVKLDVSSNKALGNKEPTESMALPVAAAPGHDPDKTPGQSPAGDQGSSATWGPAPVSPESGGAAPSKPKDSSFLDKLFKLDKGREKAPVDSQQEAKSSERRDQAEEISGLSRPSDDVPAERDIAGSKGREEQEIPTVSGSVPGNPEERDPAKEDLQTTNTTENNNSIMSFFKTLVSPNKAETKKDLEDTGAEKSPATSSDIKSDKANFISQETRGAAKNPTSTDTAKEAAKEKGGPTSLPLGKLFWKKTSDSAEKAVTCPEPEPAGAGQKGKEGSSKDKKVVAEGNKQKSTKQEAKEPVQCVEPAVVEANSLQNGDRSQKKQEKRRQSLGGFFKGLGPKRMLDAQVQTDPVSIGPVGKSK